MPSDSGSELDSSWDTERLNLGNLDLSTDTEVQFRQCFTEKHDKPSGNEDDTLTHSVMGSDADDEDSRAGHIHFSKDYVEAESDEEDEPPLMTSPPTPPTTMDGQDANAGVPTAVPRARPRNRGTQRKKEQGPGNQKQIVNFAGDDDYQVDRPMWKHGSSFPRDTVQVPDLKFQPEPTSKRSNGLLFDLAGFQPLDFFLQMWPRELFDYIADEMNRHYEAGEDCNRRCSEYSFVHLTLFQ